jgi:hypothetical protein
VGGRPENGVNGQAIGSFRARSAGAGLSEVHRSGAEGTNPGLKGRYNRERS